MTGGFFYGVDDSIFEKGNVGKLLMKFSIPAIISLLVSELYNMVDTVFVGRVIGGNGIGALVVVFPIQRIIVAISMMIAIGSSTAIARSSGEKDYKNVQKIIKNSISLTFSSMIPLTILIFIFKDSILKSLGASNQILPYAHEYLSIIVFGSIFQSLTISIGYMMMALGNRKVALQSTMTGAICNAIVDFIFVVLLDFGVKGAAIATVLSQIVSFIYAYYHFVEVKKKFKLSLGFKFNADIWKGITTVGFSAFIVEAEDGILLAILNNLLLKHAGDMGVIVLGVISKLSMFMFINMLGISSAMQPIAAYNLGAENYKRLKEVVRKTIIYALLTSLGLWAITMIFTPQLISIFVKDKNIVKEAVKAFRIMVSVLPLISLYYVSIYYFQALGKAKKSFTVSILRQIIILLPVSILLIEVFDLGALAVWLSYPIADFTSSVVAVFLMRKESKKLDKTIRKAELEAISDKEYEMNSYEKNPIQDDMI
ncbi:putative efflux protein, MATE family [Sporanaerobacter acetigenes DSM 13106]|uniref:Multidrug export protein MepA n=1 Tax=Sporanaerobacter acetigenes DSM 13106 TaxID=1123281 RepID=A0A1M5YZ18_9FIRM|nr:putative efflux protein, MATE family [Sporanaerobacter acetigenes DSM 13106]